MNYKTKADLVAAIGQGYYTLTGQPMPAPMARWLADMRFAADMLYDLEQAVVFQANTTPRTLWYFFMLHGGEPHKRAWKLAKEMADANDRFATP